MASRFRHVAITGGSSGIGAALALEHAAPGVRLSLSGRNQARLEAVLERCRAKGAVATSHQVDVTDVDAVNRWIATIDAEQPLELVYANAGLGGSVAMSSQAGEPPGVAARIVATNLTGVIHVAEAAVARFQPRQRGHFVAIGSIAGRLGLPHSPSYSASKAGVATYMEGLRRLIAGQGIDFTLVEPGFVDTPMSVGVPDRDLFLWTVEKAAREIRVAVEARRAVFRFPWQLDLLLHVARHLPRALVDRVLISAYRKAWK